MIDPSAPGSSATDDGCAAPDFEDVRAAARLLSGQVMRTPCVQSQTLSQIAHCELWLKFENLQFTASFKERGALVRLSRLDAAQRRQGVVAASAGNHAQGVAYHAQRLGIPAAIYMPRSTPLVKAARTEAFGAEVVLTGDSLEEAKAQAIERARTDGRSFVHPYDDRWVIAGQGTVALEMLEQAPDIDTLLVPVGGGGLISGMAIAARALRPDLRIVGVQTARYPSMHNVKYRRNDPCDVSTLAEGIGVKEPGVLTSAIVQRLVDEIVLVEEADIEHAIVLLLDIEKTLVEGAGAAALAALLRDPGRIASGRFAGRRVGMVLTGGNIDPLLLAGVVRRGMVRAGRLAQLRVDISDRPGALAELCRVLGAQGANIEEIAHQRAFNRLSVERTEVNVVIQTRGSEHVAQVLAALHAAGYAAERRVGADGS